MSAPSPTRVRLVERDGRVVVPRIGVDRSPFHDVYFALLRLSWLRLLPLLFAVYAGMAVVFAGLYWLDPTGVQGARPDHFRDYFFFSIHTLATIGYGTLAPQSTWAHVLVTIEAFTGLVAFAMLTGLTFAKFSSPTARVIFSRRVVVGAWNGRPTLMLRMANGRDGNVVEAQVRLTLVRDERTHEGGTMRRFHDLALVRSWNPIFALTWMALHVIDETSPLHGLSADALAASNGEILVAFSGREETLGQTVHARYSYGAEDVAWGARFVDVIEHDHARGRRVNYTRLHDVEVADDRPPRSPSAG